MFDVDTQICNYQDVVTNCEREGKVPECTDELRDNSVCRETEQSESLDLPVRMALNGLLVTGLLRVESRARSTLSLLLKF